MSDLNEEFVTCYKTIDLAEASVVRSYLESNGIRCFLPDEHLTGLAWHLTGAVGGVRVQVMKHQLDDANEALENYSPVGDDSSDENEEEIEPAIPDNFAKRAFNTSIIGMFFLPFLHPYAVYLALRAVRNWEKLTTGERTKVMFSLIFSSLNSAAAIVLIYQRYK